MRHLLRVSVVLMSALCVIGLVALAQTANPCTKGSGATSEPDQGIVEMMPLINVVDPIGDLRLLNPLNALYGETVREVFGLEDVGDRYLDYELERIPRVLDLAAVEIVDEGDAWRVIVFTAEADPGALIELASIGQARIVLFVDIDLDYSSDVLVTTLATHDGSLAMMAVDAEHNPVEGGGWIDVEVSGDQLTFLLPKTISGQHFSWILTSGFSLSPEAGSPAVNNDLIQWNPIVDIVFPDWCPPFCEIAPQFETSFRINSPCQTWKEVGTLWNCGTSTPKPNSLPGPLGTQGHTGKLFQYMYCGSRRYELWCSKDWISWVSNGNYAGWYAHCPYYGGQNGTAIIDTNNDGNPEGYVHTTVDPYNPRKVEYVYKFGPPYYYQINLYTGSNVNKCMNLSLETTNPWALPDNKCTYP